MRKIIFLCGLLCALNANAHEGWRHGGGHYVYHPNFGWSVPVIIGGAIVGYEIGRAQGAVSPQPVYPPPPVVQAQPPYGYHWEAVLDASCNCYRTVAVPN